MGRRRKKLTMLPQLPLTTAVMVGGERGRERYFQDMTAMLDGRETLVTAKVISSDVGTVEVVWSDVTVEVVNGVPAGRGVVMELLAKKETTLQYFAIDIEIVGNAGTEKRIEVYVQLVPEGSM